MTIARQRDRWEVMQGERERKKDRSHFNKALVDMLQLSRSKTAFDQRLALRARRPAEGDNRRAKREQRSQPPRAAAWSQSEDQADQSQRRAWVQAKETVVEDTRHRVQIDHRQTVGRLAGQMRVRGSDVLAKLAELGHRSRRLTDFLDATVADLIVTEFGMVPVSAVDAGKAAVQEGAPTQRRGPVVCVMGHVDHGKTTLLDALRREHRALYEAGHITQSIGAFRVDLSTSAASSATSDLASIDHSAAVATFLDTPGHAAFRAMRERGASSSCTDLIVLVISAVDGIQPQTVEVIELSKQHEVPVIVAINKCDLDGADPRRVKEQLCMYDIVTEDMGGEVLAVEISAKLGTGLPLLKENILLASDMLDLRAPATGSAQAYVIESRRERSQGCVMNVVVRSGALRVGEYFVCGLQHGPIRALVDERGKRVEVATPSMGVQVLGASTLEDMTEDLLTVASEEEAVQLVSARRQLVDTAEAEHAEHLKEAAAVLSDASGVQKEVFKIKASRAKYGRVAVKPLSAAEKKDEANRDAAALSLIIKADVMGALEALLDYVHRLPSDEVTVTVVRSGIGEVNDADVVFAEQLGAMVVGFNVPIASAAATRAKQAGVAVTSRDIIYFAMDDIRDAASRKLPAETEMRVVGSAEVAQLYPQRKSRASEPLRVVAGVKVKDGELLQSAVFRVLRDGERVYEGSAHSLRVFNKAVQKVEKGAECGVLLQHWNEVEVGDVLECVNEVRLSRLIDDGAARGFETVHNPQYDLDGEEKDELVRRKKRQAQELKGASTMTYSPAAVRAKLKASNRAAA